MPTSPDEPWAGCGLVVVAGGASRRMGGVDKLSAALGGRSVLDALLEGVPAPVVPVVVGPARPLGRPVLLTREEPPGAGPAAAVEAGVRLLTAAARVAGTAVDLVAVLAGDAPEGPSAVPALVEALRGAAEAPAAAAVDPGGRRQPLLAVHRLEALRRRLAAASGGLAGRPASWLLDDPAVVEVAVGWAPVADLDTPADMARARARGVPDRRRQP